MRKIGRELAGRKEKMLNGWAEYYIKLLNGETMNADNMNVKEELPFDKNEELTPQAEKREETPLK